MHKVKKLAEHFCTLLKQFYFVQLNTLDSHKKINKILQRTPKVFCHYDGEFVR